MNDAIGGPVGPGWFPDPTSPARLRWWDGTSWTTHVAPRPPDPRADLAAEEGAARAAKVAVVAWLALQCVGLVLWAVLMRHWSDAFGRLLHGDVGLRAGRGGASDPFGPGSGAPLLTVTVDVVGLVVLGAFVVFLNWVHKAARLAAQSGRPARHSPGAAVGWFFVPVVQWWFPYEAFLDMTDGTDATRRSIRRWWALWVGQSLWGMVVLGAAFGSVPLQVAATAVAVLWAVATLLATRRVIDVVVDDHRRLVGSPAEGVPAR